MRTLQQQWLLTRTRWNNSLDIYGMFGHQAEKYQEAVEQFGFTLDLLRQLHDGIVKPCDVKVSESGWEIIQCKECKGETDA